MELNMAQPRSTTDPVSSGGLSTDNIVFDVPDCCNVDAFSLHRDSALSTTAAQAAFADVFGRPRILSSGVLPATSDTSVFTRFLNDISFFTSFGDFTSIIKMFGAVRYRLVFKITVEASSYDQGFVVLAFQPGPNPTLAANLAYDRTRSMMCTSIPHVMVDVCGSHAAELTIPWVSRNDVAVLSNGVTDRYDFGTVSLYRMTSGSTAAGVASARYTLYWSLADVEFFGTRPTTTTDIVLQSGIGAMAREQVLATKPSSVFSVASRITSWVAKGVPSLSAYAAPLAWMLDQTSRTLRSFGYSRPSVQPSTMTTVPNNYGNIDVPFPGAIVAPTATCATVISPSLGYTDVDEMSIAYIASRPSYIFRGLVNGTLTTGTCIYATQVCPYSFWMRKSTDLAKVNGNIAPPLAIAQPSTAYVKTCIQPSNLFFLANYFKLWRGSFTFRVTFSSNPLHTGKFLMTYVPFPPYTADPSKATVPAVSNSSLDVTGFSKLVDLQAGKVFEFDVPFEYMRPWCDTTASTGTFSILVDQPMIAPVTVSPQFDYLVEVYSKDIEFSCPNGVTFPTHAPTNAAEIVYQSGIVTPAADTTGHVYKSLKQVIQTPHYEIWDVNTSKLTLGLIRQRLVIPPWFYLPRRTWYNTTVASFNTTRLTPRYFSPGGNVAAAFNFVRGGTDLFGFNASTIGVVENESNSSNEVTPATSYTWRNYPCSGTPQNTGTGLRFPMMMDTPRISPFVAQQGYEWAFGSPLENGTFDSMPRPALSTNVPLPPWPAIVASFPQKTFTSQRIGVAASDDGYCAQFMGPAPFLIPPLQTPAPTISQSYDPYLDINQKGLPVTATTLAVTGASASPAAAPPPPPPPPDDQEVGRDALPRLRLSSDPIDPSPHPESPMANRHRQSIFSRIKNEHTILNRSADNV